MPARTRSTAISSPDLLSEIGKRMLRTGDKYYILFQMLVKTGISCTQLLEKKVSDVRNKDSISYHRQKTNLTAYLPLDEDLKKEIALYTFSMPMDGYLFPANKYNQPLNIYLIQKRLKDISTELQIPEISVRSLMKTYQYNEYIKGGECQKRIKSILHIYSRDALETYFGISLPSEEDITCKELQISMEDIYSKLMETLSHKEGNLTNSQKNEVVSLIQEMEKCLHGMDEPD